VDLDSHQVFTAQQVPSKDAEEKVTSALEKASTHETTQGAQEDSPSSPPAENEAAASEMEEPQKEITLEVNPLTWTQMRLCLLDAPHQ